MSAPRPIASGDTFSYSGSLSQTYTQSAPCPQPTSTASASISVNVTDTATTAPGGGAASTSTAVETDAYPTQTGTTTTAQLLQISGSKLLLYSTNSSDGFGNSIQTTYNTAQEIDDLGTGGTWSNTDPSGSVSETLADGGSVTRTIATDGSYKDVQTYAGGGTATINVNGVATGNTLDGSGSYVFAGVTFAYLAPSGGNITLDITSPSGNKSRSFPAWFAVPSSGGYITDSFADNGSKPFDASCNVPSAIGTSGTQVVETYNVLDPILGYTETRTTTTYDVAGWGPACVVIADTLKSYYDYSQDTTRIDYQSTTGQPNSVNAIDETLSVQSGACGAGGNPPCAQLRRADNAQPVSPVAVAGRIAAIEHQRDVERAKRMAALRAFALHFVHQGALR